MIVKANWIRCQNAGSLNTEYIVERSQTRTLIGHRRTCLASRPEREAQGRLLLKGIPPSNTVLENQAINCGETTIGFCVCSRLSRNSRRQRFSILLLAGKASISFGGAPLRSMVVSPGFFGMEGNRVLRALRVRLQRSSFKECEGLEAGSKDAETSTSRRLSLDSASPERRRACFLHQTSHFGTVSSTWGLQTINPRPLCRGPRH